MMMQRYIGSLCFFALFWAYSPGIAIAAVSERDWKAPGDGLLTFDDVNNREWLDLSETLLEQFPGATLEDRYQSVVAELTTGGMFEGFTVANGDEVIALAQSAEIGTSCLRCIADVENNIIATGELITLLSPTSTFIPHRTESIGYLDVLQSPPVSPPWIFSGFFVDLRHLSSGYAGLLLGGLDGVPEPATTGVMLYRRAIPEPTCLLLSCTMLYFIMASRCSRRR